MVMYIFGLVYCSPVPLKSLRDIYMLSITLLDKGEPDKNLAWYTFTSGLFTDSNPFRRINVASRPE